MILKCFINGKAVTADISPDMALLEFVRSQGCYSVKRGCDTTTCGFSPASRTTSRTQEIQLKPHTKEITKGADFRTFMT